MNNLQLHWCYCESIIRCLSPHLLSPLLREKSCCFWIHIDWRSDLKSEQRKLWKHHLETWSVSLQTDSEGSEWDGIWLLKPLLNTLNVGIWFHALYDATWSAFRNKHNICAYMMKAGNGSSVKWMFWVITLNVRIGFHSWVSESDYRVELQQVEIWGVWFKRRWIREARPRFEPQWSRLFFL